MLQQSGDIFLVKPEDFLSLAFLCKKNVHRRGESRTAATSKMDLFVIKVNGWKPLANITKSSILDVAAVLDPPLHKLSN